MIFLPHSLYPSYFNRSIEKRVIGDVERIISIYPRGEKFLKEFNGLNLNRIFGFNISLKGKAKSISIKREQIEKRYYIKVIYPYPNSDSSIELIRDITDEKSISQKYISNNVTNNYSWIYIYNLLRLQAIITTYKPSK